MPNQLKDVVLDEISLVDRPANPHSRVMLWKRDGSGDADPVSRCLLVAKCLAAIEKADLSGLDPAEFEEALDALARERVQSSGENYHQAYSAILKSEAGKRLYRGLVASGLDPAA